MHNLRLLFWGILMLGVLGLVAIMVIPWPPPRWLLWITAIDFSTCLIFEIVDLFIYDPESDLDDTNKWN